MPTRPIRTAVLISISAWLAACAGGKDVILPQDGKTMLEIYHEHFERTRMQAQPGAARERLPLRSVRKEELDLHGYTRDADHEIRAIFPRLPNPTLVMYVFPHLSGEEGHPVPGYATSFPMYERVEYALPGEAVPR